MTVCEDPDFACLPEDLAGLFAQSGERSFFAQAGWYEVLSRHAIAPGNRTRLYLDRGPNRSGLVCRAAAPQGGGLRELRSLSGVYSCEHGMLWTPASDVARAAAEIAAEIARERPAWDAVILEGLDPSDPGFAALAAGFRAAGMIVRPVFDSGTWYEDTAGLGFADYVAGRPSVLRNTWRRKSAKLARSGQLGWRFFDSPEGIEQGIADYETIYRSSWKRSEPFVDFMPALMRSAAALGALRLGVLSVGGQPGAAQFWLVWRGRACIYKLAHDERFDELSLGTILGMRMMERVLERDRPYEVNFGRGDDPYKKLWLPKRRERWGLSAANPRTLKGMALGLRHLASRAVRALRPGEPVPPV